MTTFSHLSTNRAMLAQFHRRVTIDVKMTRSGQTQDIISVQNYTQTNCDIADDLG